jgi:hypothetical protein
MPRYLLTRIIRPAACSARSSRHRTSLLRPVLCRAVRRRPAMGRRLARVALATASSTVCAHGRSQPRLRHLEKSIAFKIGLGRLRPLHAFVGVAAILISVRHGCPRLLVTSWSSPSIFLLSPFDGVELKSFCSASRKCRWLTSKDTDAPCRSIVAAGRVRRPGNVLQYPPRHARPLGDIHRDQEWLVARKQLCGRLQAPQIPRSACSWHART